MKDPPFPCPRCRVPLQKLKSQFGWIWACRQCQGRALALAVVRKQVEPDVVRQLWRKVNEAEGRPGAPCPVCATVMDEVTLSVGDDSIDIDVCRPCHFLWFDRLELDCLPARPPAVDANPSAAARRALALRQFESTLDRDAEEAWLRSLRRLLFWVDLPD